ncbi:MAG TPA: histidine kinase [Pyrinomonadaceae bacterium]|jgi:signal transduction histidine kinase
MRKSFALPFGWGAVALFVAGWTLLGLTFASLSHAVAVTDGRPFDAAVSYPKNLCLSLTWAALSPLVFRLTRRFPVDLRPPRLRNLLAHVPSLLAFSAAHHAAYMAAIWWLLGGPHGGHRYASVVDFYRGSFAGSLTANVLIYALIVIGSQALLNYEGRRAAEASEERLKAQLAEARLRVLKMQLHPHFLFNTLHSINSLVTEDPAGASQMIARLGDFLRLTLEHSERQFVTLAEEVEFLRCYLDIERVRFQDRLTVEFDVEHSAAAAEVPHLILQPIVENAIRHAVAPRAGPGRIRVAARRADGWLRVEVKDSGPGLAAPASRPAAGAGVGLSNVRARLEQLYAGRHRFELANGDGGGLSVTLELPLDVKFVGRDDD